MKCLRLAPVVLVVAVPGLASAVPQGDQTGRAAGLKFYSASIAGGVDIVKGSATTDRDSVEDSVLTLIPTAVAYASRRGSFQFIYEPEIDLYYEKPDLSALNHALGAAYSASISRDVQLRIGGTFLRTNDRSREGGGLVVAPRGIYKEGRVYVASSYRINNDTSLGAQVASRATQTDVLQLEDESDQVDQLTTTMGASLSRSFGRGRTHQVNVGYARLLTTFLNPGELQQGPTAAPREGQDSVTFRYTLSLPSELRFMGSAGTIRLPQSGRSDQFTYSLSGRVTKSWGPLTFGGGYRRSLSGLFQLDSTDPVDPADQIRDPLLSRNVAESVDISLIGQVGRRLTISHQLRATRTFLEAADDRLESIAAFLNVGIAMSQRISPFVSLWYWEQNATEFSPSVTRARLTAGFRFFFEPSRSARGQAPQESLRSVLPVRRGR